MNLMINLIMKLTMINLTMIDLDLKNPFGVEKYIWIGKVHLDWKSPYGYKKWSSHLGSGHLRSNYSAVPKANKYIYKKPFVLV